jgi:CspA family cold shock protein
MAKGTVRWFNSQKGYGYIQSQGGDGENIFVHISAVERAGLSSLNGGQVVEYEEILNRGGITCAENLRVCADQDAHPHAETSSANKTEKGAT